MKFEKVFEYDIQSAHPTIMKKIGYKFEDNFAKLSKLDKNITIGKIFKNDIPLRIKVNNYVESVMYIFSKLLSNKILIMYDAIYTNTFLDDIILENFKNKYGINIRLKSKYDIVYIFHNKKQLIAFNNKQCVIKGIRKTIGLEKYFYNNYYSKLGSMKLGKLLNGIFRNDYRDKSFDLSLFLFRLNDDKYEICLKDGVYELDNDSNMDYDYLKDKIDYNYYYDLLFKPFLKQILSDSIQQNKKLF